MVLERAQFLDMTLDSAELMMVLGGLLAESAALKRADAMLRQALEYFWRELKGPHQAVARCYKVRDAVQRGAACSRGTGGEELPTALVQLASVTNPWQHGMAC